MPITTSTGSNTVSSNGLFSPKCLFYNVLLKNKQKLGTASLFLLENWMAPNRQLLFHSPLFIRSVVSFGVTGRSDNFKCLMFAHQHLKMPKIISLLPCNKNRWYVRAILDFFQPVKRLIDYQTNRLISAPLKVPQKRHRLSKQLWNKFFCGSAEQINRLESLGSGWLLWSTGSNHCRSALRTEAGFSCCLRPFKARKQVGFCVLFPLK